MEYFVACNYFWLLVEAVFLHTLLFTAVLTKRRLLKRYMLLGWGKAYEFVKIAKDKIVVIVQFWTVYWLQCHIFPGTPILFVTPWTVVKILHENTGWVFFTSFSNCSSAIDQCGNFCFTIDAGQTWTNGSGGSYGVQLSYHFLWVNSEAMYDQYRPCSIE